MVKYFTPEGLEKLKKELEYLKTVKRKEISEKIRHSAAQGDLKENAGYHAAKDEQGFLEGRIIELSEIIANAKVIKNKEKDKIQLGSIVLLDSSNVKDKFQIVESEEADISKGKISLKSSLGEALLGKKKGDVVKINTPGGVKEYKIIQID